MLPRHNLVWLSAVGWQQALAQAAPSDRAALMQWQAQDWPAIVRRHDADAGPGQLCLGVALPPDRNGHKRRIALRVSHAGVTRQLAALSLDQVVQGSAVINAPAIPAAWREHLPLLLQELRQLPATLTLAVYGSFALQVLTGQPYVQASSDIDVLLRPISVPQLQATLALLIRHAAWLPLDGELVFPGELAVAWKEWARATSADRVLVKRAADVVLMRVDALLATLAVTTCAA
ncbi:malonate decarboxylase holo-[acyl-carrier-protein] synthase [Herbaspirillum autotrophicum]|uniref:malonate decarboxylase holo-[acyl-carrier-protein] synthase n=1 Tax=Herbaspirillum autotrophicum TaxID=180195 RepID=UPI00067B7230|nr:malonate decarboxylase holo-[acyl-carrier-protein] synthase [Herbaspirillum autotrophicum]